MIRRAVVASLAAFSILASLAAGAVGDQNVPPPTLPKTVCSTSDLKDIVSVYDFDSPAYKGAAETVPAGVKSYLSQLIVDRLHSCAGQSGRAAVAACSPAKSENDPRSLWKQLSFCEGVVALADPKPVDPPLVGDQPLMSAQEPTLYVVLSVGGGPGGAPGGTSSGGGSSQSHSSAGASSGSSAGGRGGSGPASGSTATGSNVDNPAYFLMFLVAQRFERDVCARAGISVHECDSQHPVAVVPETTWNLEDFRTQCTGDPYVPNDPSNPYGSAVDKTPAGHGTLGAIVLNGSTVTADGTFAVVTVYGSSEANFTAQMVGCNASTAPALSAVWSDNISEGNKTTALSFFPIALAGTLIEARAAARAASLPAPSSSSSPNTLSTFINYQTDVALGTFAANASSLTLGNPSSGLTFRHTFEAWAATLEKNFDGYCRLQPSQTVCRALRMPASQ